MHTFFINDLMQLSYYSIAFSLLIELLNENESLMKEKVCFLLVRLAYWIICNYTEYFIIL